MPARSRSTRRSRRELRARVRAVGVDTGGTFTDFVASVGGALIAFKLPSTPRSPERAVLEGLARLGADAHSAVRHGSTVATNTLLERKGARVTFLTTTGFEDLLEIGRQERPEIYALRTRRVAPLVPASRRLGVRERLEPGGRARVPLTAAEARRVARAATRTRPESVAIGLLHSYANPAHERRLEQALAALGVPVTRSSALCPEIREFERFATTVTNAYLAPRVASYVEGLRRGTRARVEIVLSHGGTAPPAEAIREPARQLLSGPAAGLRAARDAARTLGFDQCLTLDVGGTSTDCAFVAGELPRRRAREVAGFPVLLPLLDVHTVGAGGGSIARADEGGLLRVGPESAGADPGPACYGRNGPATVTDALVTLGMIAGESLASGTLTLDREAARRAMQSLARSLGLRGSIAAAEGVLTLANAHMEAALRRVSVERGHDPRGAALVAFGGAGGLHALSLAESLGSAAVVWPAHAGVLSALGALTGGSRRERSRSVLLDARHRARLERAWSALEREVLAGFEARDRSRVRLERWAEVRYRGQSHELALAGGARLAERFHREHERRFGFSDPDRGVEVVTVEARAALAGERPRVRRARRSRSSTQPLCRMRTRECQAWVNAAVWNRAALPEGFAWRGPALALDSGATLWVPSGWRASTCADGTLVLRPDGK